jgi:hypothetical protein
MFNNSVEMLVLFKNGVDLAKLKQSPYNLSPRDQEVIDQVIDLLV